MTERIAKLIYTLDEIEAEAWDACANPDGLPFDPFVSHAFLHALEKSGSANEQTGWAACHLLLTDTEESQVYGVAPMYLKNHSQGEYVFDHNWAHAFERAGGQYYPKLQVSIPFTPATGRRLLFAPEGADPLTEQQLLAGCLAAAQRLAVSSVHMTFMEARQCEHLAEQGMLHRTDQQFHWTNDGYGSFEEFLETLTSRKRKNLKKERALALQDDITIEWITGDDLQEHHWDAFYSFYMDTGSRKWGSPYLTREFFSLVSKNMASSVLLILCRRQGRYIAGALNFIGSETLYGRNWGCIEDHRFLHFETCYYQAIDFAIARGLQRVEAGAQGAHKLARGYLPCKTHSLHWIADPNFRSAVADYLKEEKQYVELDIENMRDHSPFKKSSF